MQLPNASRHTRQAADSARSDQPSEHKECDMDSNLVEELTRRLPTAELVKIIKGALECGRRNVPFTESDLLRAMTFGASSTQLRAQRDREPEAQLAGGRSR